MNTHNHPSAHVPASAVATRPHTFQPQAEAAEVDQPALRTRIYDVLRQLPCTELTSKDIAMLLDVDQHRVGQTLAQLVDNPRRYPGLHRPVIGRYLYDPARPSSTAVRYASRQAKNRGKKARRAPKSTISLVPAPTLDFTSVLSAAIPQPMDHAPAMTPEAATPVRGLDRFVEVLPVFDTHQRAVVAHEVLLRDADGNLWLASQVN